MYVVVVEERKGMPGTWFAAVCRPSSWFTDLNAHLLMLSLFGIRSTFSEPFQAYIRLMASAVTASLGVNCRKERCSAPTTWLTV